MVRLRLTCALAGVLTQWCITLLFALAGLHSERSFWVAFVVTTLFGAIYGWLMAPAVMRSSGGR